MNDFLHYSINNLFGFSLVLIRISGLTVVSPIFGGEQVPKKIRAFFALFMSLAIYPGLSLNIDVIPLSMLDYFLITFKELCIGIMIGFLSTALFFGFQMGGRYMAIHMGMSMGRTLDPTSGMQTSLVGQILNFVVLTTFLIVNGHHFILKALYESFIIAPPLEFNFSIGFFDLCIKNFNVVIETSLKVAIPTMAALFAINLVFGFIARVAPKMNVFILSLPAKIAAGIVIVTVAMPAI